MESITQYSQTKLPSHKASLYSEKKLSGDYEYIIEDLLLYLTQGIEPGEELSVYQKGLINDQVTVGVRYKVKINAHLTLEVRESVYYNPKDKLLDLEHETNIRPVTTSQWDWYYTDGEYKDLPSKGPFRDKLDLIRSSIVL